MNVVELFHRRRRVACPSRSLLIWAVATLFALPSPAIIFFSTDDPSFNTNTPSGNLANSGWQLQGHWGSFLGTPIAPNLFITAKHVGGAVGGAFHFRGVDYSTIDSFSDPKSDLRIYRICGEFPEYAELYDKRDELGKSLVVFGRGTRRGEEVIADALLGTELKGWGWGPGDGVQRWGENVVSADLTTDSGIGEFLGAEFDAGGGPHEAHLSSGDSGGAVFIQDNGIWKLAGINYAVDGPFNTNNVGTGFDAALFDMGGTYQKDAGNWEYTTVLPTDQPSSFYATRISGNIEWIEGVIADQTGSTAPVLQSTPNLSLPFGTHAGYSIDENAKTITLPEPAGTLFLRIADCSGVNILSAQVAGGQWILTYGP